MKLLDFNLQGVLDKELYTSPPLMPVIVARLNGTHKDIPKAFRLTKDLQTAEFRHLRRIRNSDNNEIECIITKCRGSSQEEREEEVKVVEEMLSEEQLFKNFRIENVPSSAPRTDHQLKACAQIWPCKFAKSNYLIQCIEGSVFSQSERTVLKIIVNKLIAHVNVDDQTEAKAQTGAVIFRCAKIFGAGLTDVKRVKENPTKHAIMLAIDSVAHNAGAGHWTELEEEQDLIKSIQDELDKHEGLKEHRIDAKFLPYLCTNYDVFSIEEPCLMCAMGLVQSRIRRLFYLSAKSRDRLKNTRANLCYPDGAIEHFYIHRERSLNHRFEAWKVELGEEEEKEEEEEEEQEKIK